MQAEPRTRPVRPTRRVRALLLLIALPLCACGGPNRASLLLVTFDTVRADHLSTYGYTRATSPNVDRLAERGAVFEDVVAVAPETQPACAALLTGQWPAALDIHGNAEPLDREVGTLATHLAEHGYDTAAFVSGLPLVARLSGLERGFARYDDALPDPRGPTPGVQRSAEKTTRAVLDWLRTRDAERPFFAWVHFYDAHGDYRPIEPQHGRFTPDAPGPRIERARIPRYQRLGDETDASVYVARYDEEILRVDAALGRILETLDELGLADRTLVALTADHGESLTEHEYYFDHGNELYAPSLHVPFVVAGPGAPPPGTRDDRPANTTDMAPSLLAWLGAPPLPRAAGRSLAGGGDTGRVSESLSEARFTRYPRLASGVDVGPKLALRSAQHTVVLRLESGTVELYDRQRDTGETRDLLASDEPETRSLATQLRQDLVRVHDAATRRTPLPRVFVPELTARIAALDAMPAAP